MRSSYACLDPVLMLALRTCDTAASKHCAKISLALALFASLQIWATAW